MIELKAFGELSIEDRLYVFCKNNGNFFVLYPKNLRTSEDKPNHIEVKDDNDDVTDLPCGDNFYEDEYFIYSTNKNDYEKWCVPNWEKEVKVKQERIAVLQYEIEELKVNINRASIDI